MFLNKRNRVAVFSILFLLFGFAPLMAQTTAQTDITGDYSCTGTNPGNVNPYQGTVSIFKLGSTTYRLVWKFGGTLDTGIGIRNGNMLSVSWYAPKRSGIVVYQISDFNGSLTLNGEWAVSGSNGALGTETLAR